MASDGNSGPIPATSVVQGSQAPTTVSSASGKSLPAGGKSRPQAASSEATSRGPAPGSNAATAPPPAPPTDSQALVALLNKNLNDSGQPDQFRVDPASNELIQQINPANGAIVGQFSVEEFPALARGLGAPGGIVDDRA